jgi:DNA-binding FrmR family transcriptional regulator
MHQSHRDVIARLKRAEGHLRSVIAMIEQGRPCLDLATQLHAVEAAITKAKRELIHDHIEHCLDENGMEPKAALREFKQISKFL